MRQINFINYVFNSDDTTHIFGHANTFTFKLSLFPSLGKQKSIPMDVFGMGRDVPCCLNIDEETRYSYDKNCKEVIIQGVHSYLYQFFKPLVDYQVISGYFKLPERLHNITASKINLEFLEKKEHFEAYFKFCANQKFIYFYGDLSSKVSKNSAVYGIEYMEINSLHCHGDYVLFRFRGRSLLFKDTAFLESTIILFLNEWKSDRGFQSLKFLSIACSSQAHFNTDKIEKNVDIKHLTQSEDIPELQWRERTLFCGSPVKNWRDRTIKSRSYLIRGSDGEGASIDITPTHFVFVVWSATENPHVTEHIKKSECIY